MSTRRRRRKQKQRSSGQRVSGIYGKLLDTAADAILHGAESDHVPEPLAEMQDLTAIRDLEAKAFDDPQIAPWLFGVRQILMCHTDDHVIDARYRTVKDCHFNLVPAGDVVGVLTTDQGRHIVKLHLGLADGEPVHGGCPCEESGGQRPCQHTLLFSLELMNRLVDPDSDVVARIRRFLHPDQLEFLEFNDELERQVERHGNPPGAVDATLPEFPVTRIVWVIDEDDSDSDGFRIRPRLQRLKKNGAGWTKGRFVTFDRLRRSPELLTHPVDRGVLDVLELAAPRYYGKTEWRVPTIQGLQALAGHDAVVFEDEPVEIHHVNLVVEISRQDDRCTAFLRVPGMSDDEYHVQSYAEGIVFLRKSGGQIFLVTHDESLAQLVRRLLRFPRFPASELPEVITRFQQLGHLCELRLPESMQEEVLNAETGAVLLLRSADQGLIDCGLRFRDRQQRHFLPGEGEAVYLADDHGKTVRYRRDLAKERGEARRIVDALRLDPSLQLAPWTWRVFEMDDILALLDRVEQLVRDGVMEVAWDAESARPIRVMGRISPKNLRVVVTKKRDWFGLDGVCDTGGTELGLYELLEGIDGRRYGEFTEIRPGEFARISESLINQLRKLRDAAHANRKRLEIDAVAAPFMRNLLLDQQIDIEAPRQWQDCVKRLERAEQLDPSPPDALRGTLRDYQVAGYRWMRRLAEWGVGACLADDMGLGKTIQTLAVLLDRRDAGPALVIAPTSVGFNWVRETETFAPDLSVHLYRDTDRAGFLKSVGPGDVVICSYGLALRDAEALQSVAWGTLVLDEAQFIKNARSKTAQAIRDLHADWKVALTGTPIENHLAELWSIFRAISPGLFGSWQAFRKKFATPIERNNDDERRQALAETIRPFVLRRTKEEVLEDLPSRTETTLHVELSPEERRRYDEMRLAALGELDELVGLPDTEDHRFRILAILTRLRQLACHVGLVDESWDGPSAKLELLLQTVHELIDEGHRALIFSQFTSFLAKIRETLQEAGVSFQYLDGTTPAKRRQEAVDAFQQGDADLFLISLKAGGTGLNLTAADYVIHMDPWWNPAVEDQATDRAHRIGQTRPVMVYRMVARGTIEERILDLHREKRDLVESIMDGTQSAARLSTQELVELIRNSKSA